MIYAAKLRHTLQIAHFCALKLGCSLSGNRISGHGRSSHKIKNVEFSAAIKKSTI